MQTGARVGLDHVNLAAQVKRHGGRAQAAVLAHLPPFVTIGGGEVIDHRRRQEPLDFQVPRLVLRQHFEEIPVECAKQAAAAGLLLHHAAERLHAIGHHPLLAAIIVHHLRFAARIADAEERAL